MAVAGPGRFDLVLVNLDPTVGSEIRKTRPCVVVSPDELNDALRTLIVAPLTAVEALYGHYEKTFNLWEQAGVQVPPCFVVVCNNTSTSKLVYDYISGFHRQ